MTADSEPTGPFGAFDPEALAGVPFFAELAKLLAWDGGPVNWDLARQMAGGIAGTPQRAIGVAADEEAWADAVRVVELWLDAATGLPAVEGPARALTSAEWVQLAASSDGIGRYVEPVASGMQEAMQGGLAGQLPEELAGLGALGGLERAMRPMTALLSGMQVGTITGHLSTQLMGGYDLGVPTLDARMVTTVGDEASRFARDYGFEPHEVRFWLALREALHRRLFAGVDWLGDHVADRIGAFAAAADLDPGRLSEQLGGLGGLGGFDPSLLQDPEALQRMAEEAGGLGLEPTAEQQQIMAELQALVALVAGYTDVVVRAAADGRLPTIGRIEEAAVRRRGERGQGEQFLTQLTGIDLKPADVRQGTAFCDAVVAARGIDGLDRVWSDPAQLPTVAELAEPSRWLVRMAATEAAEGAAPDDDELPLADVEIPDDLGGLDL